MTPDQADHELWMAEPAVRYSQELLLLKLRVVLERNKGWTHVFSKDQGAIISTQA